MKHEEMLELALHAAKGTAPTNFSVENVNAALLDGFKELAPDYNSFMKNRYDIYDIVIKTADEILPKKTMDAIGMFAEVQSVGQGQKAIFKRKLGRNRAKKFLTQVGLSGVYETFRLDNETFELAGHAVGGGATVDFERMLDGAESIAEVMEVLTEGLEDAVYVEVQKALRAAYNTMQDTNKNNVSTVNKFDANEMFRLTSVVRAYGNGAVIFATPEFVGAMGADAIVPVGTSAPGVYSPDDIAAIHNTGYINLFRGTPVVQIPQSFTDETNTKTWIDPQLAYVLPTGGEKVVKVVLEGNTIIKDYDNRDGSMEFYAYKKMGCAILTTHNWGIYKNTSIGINMGTEHDPDIKNTYDSTYPNL